MRGDLIDLLQTLQEEETENYNFLVKRCVMGYGHAHLEQVYESQMTNRRQKAGESLHEFEVVTCLVRFTCRPTSENVMRYGVPGRASFRIRSEG